MTAPAIIAAINAKDPEDIRAAMIGDYPPVIPSDVDPLTYDPRELGASGGNTLPAVYWQEKIWFRDETSVAAHDEISVITLLDGVNYLTNDIRVPAAVLSYSVTTPPDIADSPPPSFGDAYLVPAASTDEWASHEDEIAIWTARGWAYVIPQHGYLVYVEDELGFYHFTASDVWEAGLGPNALPAGSVRPSALLIRSWAVENQTTTAPPATGPAGEQYIIGASATGAWSGLDKKIAWRPSTDAAFVITTPFVGEEVYDKSLGVRYRWTAGGVWVSSVGIWVNDGFVQNKASITLGTTGSGAYTYSTGTAPVVTKLVRYDTATLAFQAKRTNARLRFTYEAIVQFSTGLGDIYTIALFRNSEVNAIAWKPVIVGTDTLIKINETFDDVAALDTANNTYFIGFLEPGGSANITAAQARLLAVQEHG